MPIGVRIGVWEQDIRRLEEEGIRIVLHYVKLQLFDAC
jgi:hypothetical protein